MDGHMPGVALSGRVTAALGTDDWLILHSGHHMVSAEELDGAAGGEPTIEAIRREERERAAQIVKRAYPAHYPGGALTADSIAERIKEEE